MHDRVYQFTLLENLTAGRLSDMIVLKQDSKSDKFKKIKPPVCQSCNKRHFNNCWKLKRKNKSMSFNKNVKLENIHVSLKINDKSKLFEKSRNLHSAKHSTLVFDNKSVSDKLSETDLSTETENSSVTHFASETEKFKSECKLKNYKSKFSNIKDFQKRNDFHFTSLDCFNLRLTATMYVKCIKKNSKLSWVPKTN